MSAVVILLVAILFSTAWGLFHRCPPNVETFGDLYSHCTCVKSPNTVVDVVCQGITTDITETEQRLTFAEIVSQLRNYTIDSLTVRRSSLLSLSSNPFRRLSIHKLVFEDVTFITVSVFRAFMGLEFTLEELHFVRCNVTHWSWGHGRQFVHLTTVRFENTALPEVLNPSILRHFPNKIRTLQINGCSVKSLGNEAFRRFSHLERLELNRNRITSIQRSMFAPSLRRLHTLSLSGNPLRRIADDTFTNMVRLEFLFLSSTRLPSLKNETFFPVWNQLEEIHFDNIRINCNCDSKWMLDVPDFKIFKAPYCNSHGKFLDRLDVEDQAQLCPQ